MSTEQEENGNTDKQNRSSGKDLRKLVPRSLHGDWAPAAGRPDPLSLLQKQDEGRLQDLLPIKYGRMLASPFAFLRGSAVVMASDLSSTPVTGLDVALCGDAHLSNFGIFATPERDVAFDVNDFDETYPGPWEWDLKRLAASAVVAGRGNGFRRRDLPETSGRCLQGLPSRQCNVWPRKLTWMSGITMWMPTLSSIFLINMPKKALKQARKTVKKAQSHTSLHSFDKLTQVVDGERQFINTPPVVVRLSERLTEEQKKEADGPRWR